MKYLLFIVVLMTFGCEETSTFDSFKIGVRDGVADRVVPVATIRAGSTIDLAASVSAEDTGWIYATWTYWPPDHTMPRVVGSRMYNVTRRKTIFVPLAWDTFGPWPVGRISCDLKTRDGEFALGTITILAKDE